MVMSEAKMAELYPSIDLAQTPRGAFTGLRVKVSDMAAARACIASASIPVTTTESGFTVAPEYTSGVILEFIPA